MGAGYFSRKFTLTALSLGAVFVLFAFGKDVRELEVIIPAILAFYHASNISQDIVVSRQRPGEQENQTIRINKEQ